MSEPPPKPLNPDQEAMRRAVDRFFNGNQAETARRIGVTRAAVRHTLSGRTTPTYALLERLAEAVSEETGERWTVEALRMPDERAIYDGPRRRWIRPGDRRYELAARLLAAIEAED